MANMGPQNVVGMLKIMGEVCVEPRGLGRSVYRFLQAMSGLPNHV